MSTLSDRLRNTKMRDASEVDDTVLQRAMERKAEATQPNVGYDVHSQTARFQDDREQRRAKRAAEIAKRNETLIKQNQQPAQAATKAKSKFGQWFMAGSAAQRKSRAAITAVPRVPAGYAEAEFYEIEPPYSFARLLKHVDTGDMRYEIIEPQLTENEAEIYEFIEAALVRGLNVDPNELDTMERAVYLNRSVQKILNEYRVALTDIGQRRIEYYIRRDYLGLGRIQPLMMDDDIEDISCDGAQEEIFIYHRRYENMTCNVKFDSDGELDGYVIRLAQRSGKALTISNPMLDASLPDGSRLQATLAREVTQNGSTFTIRRFRPDPFTPLDLVHLGTMNPKMLSYFWLTMEHGMNLVFAGGTASGKTTSLNAICQFIPQQVKVVTIEDTREVNLPHKNWIKAVTRTGTGSDGAGEIDMFDLLKASLRQRPDFIVVGEVRGIEATVAFQAMATGHAVYCTMHADSARSVVYRLENEPINIPRLVLQALDIIVIQAQVRIGGKKVRRITEIVELVGIDPQTRELLTHTVFKWNSASDTYEYTGRSYMLDKVGGIRNWSQAVQNGEFTTRERIIAQTVKRRNVDMKQFNRLVLTYTRQPERVLGALEN